VIHDVNIEIKGIILGKVLFICRLWLFRLFQLPT